MKFKLYRITLNDTLNNPKILFKFSKHRARGRESKKKGALKENFLELEPL